MTKSVILKPLMTTFIIATAILFAIRSFHRHLMRTVDEHVAPTYEEKYRDHRGYLMHQDFKRRSKV
jgi:hypothetical protein